MKIYTDGACTKNGKKNSKGGFGVYIYNKLEYSENVENATNNICELMAIHYALKWIKNNIQETMNIIICTDSNYSMNSITKWIHSWKENEWMTTNNKPVKNKYLIQNISNLLDELNIIHNITFKYVSNNKHKPPPNDCDGSYQCPKCKGICVFDDWIGNYKADKLAKFYLNG